MSDHTDSIVKPMGNEVKWGKTTLKFIRFIAQLDVFGQKWAANGSKMAPTWKPEQVMNRNQF